MRAINPGSRGLNRIKRKHTRTNQGSTEKCQYGQKVIGAKYGAKLGRKSSSRRSGLGLVSVAFHRDYHRVDKGGCVNDVSIRTP